MTPEITTKNQWDGNLSLHLAEMYALIGEKDEALCRLEQATSWRIFNYPFLSEYDPFLENLRGEPRFRRLMERVMYGWERFEV